MSVHAQSSGRRARAAARPAARPRAGPAQARRRPSSRCPVRGDLVFTRLAFGAGLGGFGFGGEAWSHDYPAADRNVGAIIDYITHARVRLDGTNILTLDDPEIFQNPCSTSGSRATGRSAQRGREPAEVPEEGRLPDLRRLRGADHWDNMAAQCARPCPITCGYASTRATRSSIRSTTLRSSTCLTRRERHARLLGDVREQRPGGRMIALANHNNDIAEYLGMVGGRPLQPRPHEQRLPARRQLLHLRADSLVMGSGVIS